MAIVYLLFARWSEIDQHFQFVQSFGDAQAAETFGASLVKQGALATRIEVRQIQSPTGSANAAKNS